MTRVDMLTAVEAEYPAIAARIAAIWGEPECDAYLACLLIQDREEREGFSVPVFSALAGLQELHMMLFAPKLADVWEAA